MMTESSVRYIVHDVDAAADFYTRHLQFEGGGGAGQPLPDGATPEPGGWNRFQVLVDDLDATVDELRRAGVGFRGDTITGRGGRQALALDPSGNLIELFEAYPG
jgi:catechol 2,3-dioxygenase-like lactoylglutathione lyase family enzyme